MMEVEDQVSLSEPKSVIVALENGKTFNVEQAKKTSFEDRIKVMHTTLCRKHQIPNSYNRMVYIELYHIIAQNFGGRGLSRLLVKTIFDRQTLVGWLQCTPNQLG